MAPHSSASVGGPTSDTKLVAPGSSAPASPGRRAPPPAWGLGAAGSVTGVRRGDVRSAQSRRGCGLPAADGEVPGISAPGGTWPQARGWLPVVVGAYEDRRPRVGAPPPRCCWVLWGCRTRGCGQRVGITGARPAGTLPRRPVRLPSHPAPPRAPLG